MLYKDCDDAKKIILLKEEYEKDGADSDIATDAAVNAKNPDEALRTYFGYTDETVIS